MSKIRVLLACGIVSSLLYVATDLFAASRWPEYRYVDQAVSELSAIDAPTRPLWLVFTMVYNPLLLAFGVGVMLAAREHVHRRALRVTGSLLLVMGMMGFVWATFFPMHLRDAPKSATDVVHGVLAGVQVVMTLAAIGIASTALGRMMPATESPHATASGRGDLRPVHS